MMRVLYRATVWLHPPAFRREFGAEMLWIYDQAASPGAVTLLFLDGLVSLARQWLLRSGYWKIPAALAGALLQIMMGVALALRMGRHRVQWTQLTDSGTDMAGLVRLATFTSVGLLAAVIFLVFWWRKLARRRIGV
jgi:hypothetical protein